MNLAVVLLEIDPSIVKPGWIALVVTVFIAVALLLLYLSLRRQVRKISPDLPYEDNVKREVNHPRPPKPDITSGGQNG
jgi:hypothetical protein